MRSKLSTFVALVIAAMLCTVVFASVAHKADQSGLASKYGSNSVNQIPQSSVPTSKLPPVGPRDSRGLDEIVISEDFEAYDIGELPADWTQVDVDLGYCTQFLRNSTWQVYTNAQIPAHSGTKFAMCHYNDNALPNNDWLILPQQTLTGTITLTYWASSQDVNYLDDYQIRVSTTGTNPADFTDLIQDFNQIPVGFAEHTHDLSDYSGIPFYIAFHYDATDEFMLKIDDVVLERIESGSVGVITGHVRNADTNAPVSGALVEVQGTGHDATTNAQGAFTIPNVAAGTYTLETSSPIYEDNSMPGVVVAASETTDVDILLDPLNIGFDDFASTAAPQAITDHDTSRMDLVVDEDLVITDVDVTINITHSYDSDLTIWLETPWNQRIQLAMAVGAGGDNFVNTRLDDEAATSITAGAAPFTGSFRPMETLDAADAFSTEGTWTLVVVDDYDVDEGSIDDFTLHVTYELIDAVGDPNAEVPTAFAFHGNYPNPFNATTQFMFDMARSGHASLVLYNITGQEVATLVDGNLEAGAHQISYTAATLPSGLYFARFTAPDFSATRKVILMK